METEAKEKRNTHHGHAIKRYRHTLGIKQEALAMDMGVSQALVSLYEKKKVIEDDMLEKFAEALKIAPEFIKELEEDPVTFIIENNTFEEGSMGGFYYMEVEEINHNPNPVDRLMELFNEKTALYERMLALEKEKNELLEKLLKEKR